MLCYHFSANLLVTLPTPRLLKTCSQTLAPGISFMLNKSLSTAKKKQSLNFGSKRKPMNLCVFVSEDDYHSPPHSQQTFRPAQGWRPEVQNQFHWDQCKAGPCSLWRLQGKSLPCLLWPLVAAVIAWLVTASLQYLPLWSHLLFCLPLRRHL